MVTKQAAGAFKAFLALSILAVSLCCSGCHGGSSDGTAPAGATPPAVTFSQADLHADWSMSQISAGGAYWFRGLLSIGPDGDIATEIMTSGSDEPITSEFTIEMSPEGTITVSNSITFMGGMDMGKTVIVGTEGENECAMTVCTKMEGEYSPSDLEGRWGINTLNSGNTGPYGEWGIGEIEAGGAASVERWDSHGNHYDPIPGAFTLNVDEDGQITAPGLEAWQGWLDADKTVAVQTFTLNDDIVQMTVLTKQGDSYSDDDLTGTWAMYSLASGELACEWARSTLTAGPDGEFTISGVETSDGPSEPVSGIISITHDGNSTITLDEEHGGRVIDTGHMDAGKTVIAFTNVWYEAEDDPAAQMIILLKQAD